MLLPIKKCSPDSHVLLPPTCIGRMPGPQCCTCEADPGSIPNPLSNPCSEQLTSFLVLEPWWSDWVWCTHLPVDSSRLVASRMASSQSTVAMPNLSTGVLPMPLPSIGCSHPRPTTLVNPCCYCYPPKRCLCPCCLRLGYFDLHLPSF